MEKEPILVVVRNGSTRICSLDTTQEVYIIDQRGSTNANPPTLYQASIFDLDVKTIREAIKHEQ